MDEFLKLLENEFKALLDAKTGWGKNEVMDLFYKAFARATAMYARQKGIDLT